ncbi:MAG: hypothetical protein IJV40_02270 [Oscillospiraceae bacterium]|nr:hypothetical protein [Oscillospiraceae bacterium]
MKKLAVLLCVLTALSLCACGGSAVVIEDAKGPAPTPGTDLTATMPGTAPSMPEDMQKQLLEDNRALWAFTEAYESPWFYTFTDLDHNGRLEVIAASTQGTGVFTYANFYEVRADGSGIENCYHAYAEIEGQDDWPEIVRDSLPCYYDRANNRYYYACEGVTRSGYAHQYYAWYALCLKDGAAEWELIASKNMDWDEQGTESVVCRDAQGNSITEQDYDIAVERRFGGLERSTLQLAWTQEEIPYEEDVESGSWMDEPAIPAEEPTGPQVVITKNPSSEALAIGGKTWFIAHADNALSLTWQMVSPDGFVYSLEETMAANPGLALEALEGDTIAVSNVPLSMNGWGVQARFDGQGNSAVTEPAYLYVGDFISAYSGVIEKYRVAYSSGNSGSMEYAWNHEISEMISYSGGVGYALKDLDKNGIPELIIEGMGTDNFSEQMAYDLYTLVNGMPVNIATSRARLRYYVRTDSTILSEGSSGASYSYFTVHRLNGSTLEETEMVFTNADQNASGEYYTGCYYQQGHSETLPSEKSIAISDEEFRTRVEQMESSIYVPPLTKIY